MKPADVYDALLTPVGIDRALTKLSTLKGSLVWWDNSADAIAMVNDGRAVMATALNGDVYDTAQHHHPVGVVWDSQLYELDVFGVPKGNPRKDMAMDFVRFATGSQDHWPMSRRGWDMGRLGARPLRWWGRIRSSAPT